MLSTYDDQLSQNSPTLQAATSGKLSYDPGNLFSESFRLFSKDPGTLIGMTVISILLISMLIFIPFIGMLGIYLLLPGLFGGLLIALRDLDTTNTTTFNRLFDAFKNFTNTALIYFVTSLIIGALPLIAMFSLLGSSFYEFVQISAGGTDQEQAAELVSQFSSKIVLLYAILIPYYLLFGLVPLIATTIGTFNPRMDFGAILKSSLLIAIKNPGKIALTSLLVGLIYTFGFIALCVGIVVSVPVVAAFHYLMYKQSIQPNQENTDRFFSTDDTLDSGLV